MRPWKVIWLVWCGLWALFWLIAGFFTLIGFVGVPISAAAMLVILVPDPQPPAIYPPCYRCGRPAGEHYGGRCPVRGELVR